MQLPDIRLDLYEHRPSQPCIGFASSIRVTVLTVGQPHQIFSSHKIARTFCLSYGISASMAVREQEHMGNNELLRLRAYINIILPEIRCLHSAMKL